MYLHFMGKLIHQNQIKQDLSTMHSLKKQREEYQRSLYKAYLKDFYWSFQILEKKVCVSFLWTPCASILKLIKPCK